jgi:hypothetical protein
MISTASDLIYRAQVGAKVLASRALGRLRGTEGKIIPLRFYRDADGWFVDLPNWPGPKAALAMVEGADTFLERLGKRNPEVLVEITTKPQPEAEWFSLHYAEAHPYGDGAYYSTPHFGHNHYMWLCGVTEFVLGRMPEVIYVRDVYAHTRNRRQFDPDVEQEVMSLIYQVQSAPNKGTRADFYIILELDDHHVTLAIPGLKFGRFSITRERLLEKAAEMGVKPMPHPKPLMPGPSPKPQWFSGFKKFRLVLALAFTISAQLSFAQNTFLGDREDYNHPYKCVVNTDEYAKWILVGEKTWYLAPDSITSQVMSVANWQKHRQYIKSNGFNEIDPDYYWNPDSKIVVMTFLPKKKTPGEVIVSTEYGTDIR